jgi:hypothetical protein
MRRKTSEFEMFTRSHECRISTTFPSPASRPNLSPVPRSDCASQSPEINGRSFANVHHDFPRSMTGASSVLECSTRQAARRPQEINRLQYPPDRRDVTSHASRRRMVLQRSFLLSLEVNVHCDSPRSAACRATNAECSRRLISRCVRAGRSAEGSNT